MHRGQSGHANAIRGHFAVARALTRNVPESESKEGDLRGYHQYSTKKSPGLGPGLGGRTINSERLKEGCGFWLPRAYPIEAVGAATAVRFLRECDGWLMDFHIRPGGSRFPPKKLLMVARGGFTEFSRVRSRLGHPISHM